MSMNQLARHLRRGRALDFQQNLEELEAAGEAPTLEGETFKELTLDGFVLRGINLTNVEFETCELRQVRLEGCTLDGFVLAITPFNFTSIGLNLPTAPAFMGNTVVWKPATTSALSCWTLFRVLEAAGLPPGVINLVHGAGAQIGNLLLERPELAGLHFTGSTGVFQSMWKTVGERIASYAQYPRLVGETGCKDFIVAHRSADPAALSTAILAAQVLLNFLGFIFHARASRAGQSPA